MFKPLINDLSIFKEQRVSRYLNFFSEADKTIIKHYHEKRNAAYKKRFEAFGTMYNLLYRK